VTTKRAVTVSVEMSPPMTDPFRLSTAVTARTSAPVAFLTASVTWRDGFLLVADQKVPFPQGKLDLLAAALLP